MPYFSRLLDDEPELPLDDEDDELLEEEEDDEPLTASAILASVFAPAMPSAERPFFALEIHDGGFSDAAVMAADRAGIQAERGQVLLELHDLVAARAITEDGAVRHGGRGGRRRRG